MVEYAVNSGQAATLTTQAHIANDDLAAHEIPDAAIEDWAARGSSQG
jgi:hypothetical protein